MVRGEVSPGHFRSHVPPVQLTEQDPVQVTWHVASAQLTLPLAPTVMVQVLPLAQDALHDRPHVPLQLALPAHWSEQLSLLPVHPAAWAQP